MRYYRHILHVPYPHPHRVTYEEVRQIIRRDIDQYEDIMSSVRRREMTWYGHVKRSNGLEKKHPPKHSERGKKEADRTRTGRATSKNGEASTSANHKWQQKTSRGGNRLVYYHWRYPNHHTPLRDRYCYRHSVLFTHFRTRFNITSSLLVRGQNHMSAPSSPAAASMVRHLNII